MPGSTASDGSPVMLNEPFASVTVEPIKCSEDAAIPGINEVIFDLTRYISTVTPSTAVWLSENLRVPFIHIESPAKSLSTDNGPQVSSDTSTMDMGGQASKGIQPRSASPRF